MYSLRGPLFFGAARSLRDAPEAMPTPPRVFILRMRTVPMIDSSAVAALSDFMRRCRARRVAVLVPGIRPQPPQVLTRMGFVIGAGGRHDTLPHARTVPTARHRHPAALSAPPPPN